MLLLHEFEVNGKEVTQADNNENKDYTKNEGEDNAPQDTQQKNPNDLKQADPTGNDNPDNTPTTQNNTDAQSTDNDDMTIPDDAAPQEDSQNAENEPPADEAGEGSTDYTTDSGDDAGTDYTQDDAGDGTEDPGTDNSDLDNSVGTTEDQDNDEIRQIENELFNNLSPEQIAIKNRELKRQYTEMYSITTSLIDKINDVTKTDEITRILSFTSEKLSDLRTMVVDYIESVFDTVTYMENAINYNKYLAILNGINKIIEQISPKQDQN